MWEKYKRPIILALILAPIDTLFRHEADCTGFLILVIILAFIWTFIKGYWEE